MPSAYIDRKKFMRSILVLNPKGGCGKSTIAINIAGYFAVKGKRVTLADCDPQGSSADWIAARPKSASKIALATLKSGQLHIPKTTEILVFDTPAAIHDKKLANFLMSAHTLVIPVLASPVDIRAAQKFIHSLFNLKGIVNKKIKVVTVANRVREDTLVAAKLESYLERLKLPNGKHIPYITLLRQSQNYIRSAERGLSIFEFAPAATCYDREQWSPLVRWLSSSRSLPGK